MNKRLELFLERISKVTRRPILIQLADFGAKTQIRDLSLFGKQQRNTGKIDLFCVLKKDLFKKLIQIFFKDFSEDKCHDIAFNDKFVYERCRRD